MILLLPIRENFNLPFLAFYSIFQVVRTKKPRKQRFIAIIEVFDFLLKERELEL
jgi:hypothetical protein